MMAFLAATDVVLDGMTAFLGLATVGLGAATVYMAKKTADSVNAAEKEAEATAQLVLETREDRALATRPLLALRTTDPHVELGNVGAGPALQVVVWHRERTSVFKARSKPLGAGETETFILQNVTAGEPGPAVVDQGQLVAYCVDQLGNRLRFDLRTGDPPEVWQRGSAPPLWGAAFNVAVSI